MSKMGELHSQLETIRRVMEDDMGDEPMLTAELQLERKCDWLIRELDEICALAANHETADLVETQQLAISQMNTRIQLIMSFLLARKPSLKMVVNRG